MDVSVASVSGRGAGRDPQEARGAGQDSLILLANSMTNAINH
jgi:hypothetical protein